MGLIALSLGCSDDKSPPGGSAGSGGSSSGGGGAASTAGAGSGAGGAAAGGHPSGGAGTGNTAGASGSPHAGSAGTTGGTPQGGSQSEGGGGTGGSGPLPDEFEVATKQKAPIGIAVDDESVYWSNHDAGTIVKCPLDGCAGKAPSVVASNIGKPMGIAIAGDTLYWMAPPVDSTSEIAQVLKCPLSGCTGVPDKVFQFTVENRAVDVHVSGDTVYYAAWPQLGSCAVGGCDDKPTALPRGPAVGVDSNAESLFVARYTGPVSCSLDGCKNEKALAMNVSALGIAIDATHVYFTSYDYFASKPEIVPGVWRCPLAGCGSEEPESLKDGDVAPFGIAVNETRVFYVDTVAGSVISLAKPQ